MKDPFRNDPFFLVPPEHDGRGRPLDYILCRPRDQRYLGSVKVLHEHLVQGSGSPTWSAYTDRNLASAVLELGPPQDSRPWVLGAEAELQLDDAVAQASSRNGRRWMMKRLDGRKRAF